MARRKKEDVERDLQGILKTALRHFAQKSYEGANLEDICREVGCTRGVLYHHFSDKQDLYNAAVKSALEQGYAGFFAGVEDLEPIQQFFQWHMLQAEEIEKGEDFSVAVELSWLRKGTGRHDGVAGAQVDEELMELVEHHASLLKKARASGQILTGISSKKLSLQCNSLSIGLTLSWFLTGKSFSLRKELSHGIITLAGIDSEST